MSEKICRGCADLPAVMVVNSVDKDADLEQQAQAVAAAVKTVEEREEQTKQLAQNETEKLAEYESEKLAGDESEQLAGNETEKLAGGESEQLAGNETEKLAENATEKLAENEAEKLAEIVAEEKTAQAPENDTEVLVMKLAKHIAQNLMEIEIERVVDERTVEMDKQQRGDETKEVAKNEVETAPELQVAAESADIIDEQLDGITNQVKEELQENATEKEVEKLQETVPIAEPVEQVTEMAPQEEPVTEKKAENDIETSAAEKAEETEMQTQSQEIRSCSSGTKNSIRRMLGLSGKSKATTGKNLEEPSGVRRFMCKLLGAFGLRDSDTNVPRKLLLPHATLEGLATQWLGSGYRNIITLAGAGFSSAAGLPDFQAPSAALDACLQKYDVPQASCLFQQAFFKQNPAPLLALTHDLHTGHYAPTTCHYFVRLLHDKGLLLRHYTQNIDALERVAGVPDFKVVAQHGSLYSCRCSDCHRLYGSSWLLGRLPAGELPACEVCGGLVKPDLVFDDEPTPQGRGSCPEVDFADCDLLIGLGIQPNDLHFGALLQRLSPQCQRLFICAQTDAEPQKLQDVLLREDCDAGTTELAKQLGWQQELADLMQHERQRRQDERPQAQVELVDPLPH